MHIDTQTVQNAFSEILSSDKKNFSALEKSLKDSTKKDIHVNIVHAKPNTNLFVMCITPDKSTLTKIAEAMYSAKTMLSTISELWKRCNSWRLDIDDRIFDFLTPAELTAVTLHEIGHVSDSDAIPTRIQNIIQFSVVTSEDKVRHALKDGFFAKVLTLPLTAICQFQINPNRSDLRKEIKADKMASYNGYGSDLISALTKIERELRGKNNIDSDVTVALKYSMELLNSIAERKEKITKDHFVNMKRLLSNTAIMESVNDLYDAWFLENESIVRYNYLCDAINSRLDEAFLEFGSGKLEPIEQNQIDYIRIKIEAMSSINDKMMIVSYINSKLDLIEYYKGILNDRKLSKKYVVPHSLTSLESKEKELVGLKNLALRTKIDQSGPSIYVSYPIGYEG